MLLVTVSMSLIGVSIINVALPSMQFSLGASESDLQWVLSGYAITFGVVLVAAGRAGDVLGRGGLYVFGVVLFCAASIAAGLASDISLLKVARFVQGLGSGILSPQIIGMIQHYFRGYDRARAFGMYGTTVGLSMGLGPLLGGGIIALAGEAEGWRWTFFVNVPVSLIAITLALRWFPRPLYAKRARPSSPRGALAAGRPAGLDLDPVGIILLSSSIVIILLPFMTPPTTVWTWLLMPAGIVLVLVWVGWELRYRNSGRDPMVDMAIFRSRGFSNGVVLATIYFFGATGIWVLVALYMQQALGHTAFEAGVIGLPSAVCSAFTARWTGRHVTYYGRRIVTGGIFIAIIGMASSILVIVLETQGRASIWWLLGTLTLIGIAQGAVISPNQTITLADAPIAYAGSTGGILQTGQRIGSAIGLGVITAIVFGVQAHFGWTTAITVAFAVIIAILLLCLAVSIGDMVQRRG